MIMAVPAGSVLASSSLASLAKIPPATGALFRYLFHQQSIPDPNRQKIILLGEASGVDFRTMFCP